MTRLFFSKCAQTSTHLGTTVKLSYNSRKRTSKNACQCRLYSPSPKSHKLQFRQSAPCPKKERFSHDLSLLATSYHYLARPDTTKSLTPAITRELLKTHARTSPRWQTPAILKSPENPENPDSDNHASLQRTRQKCCFSLPHPIELHALWVCDAGGQLPKVPCSKK